VRTGEQIEKLVCRLVGELPGGVNANLIIHELDGPHPLVGEIINPKKKLHPRDCMRCMDLWHCRVSWTWFSKPHDFFTVLVEDFNFFIKGNSDSRPSFESFILTAPDLNCSVPSGSAFRLLTRKDPDWELRSKWLPDMHSEIMKRGGLDRVKVSLTGYPWSLLADVKALLPSNEGPSGRIALGVNTF